MYCWWQKCRFACQKIKNWVGYRGECWTVGITNCPLILKETHQLLLINQKKVYKNKQMGFTFLLFFGFFLSWFILPLWVIVKKTWGCSLKDDFSFTNRFPVISLLVPKLIKMQTLLILFHMPNQKLRQTGGKKLLFFYYSWGEPFLMFCFD